MLATLSLAALVSAASSGGRCGSGGAPYDVAVPGAPMSAVPSADGQTVFVSLNSTNPRQLNGIAVLRCDAGRYRFDHVVPLETQPAIAALTHDGTLLVVPDDNFIAFVDAGKAASGDPQAIVGSIEDIPNDDGGAIYAAISPDDRYAFVSEEQSAKLTVIDLARVRAGAIDRAAIVSEFLIGNAPVALTPAADGKHVFVTVQQALRRYNWQHVCKPEGGRGGEDEAPGAVVTVDMSKAASDPASAIVSYVPAGCHPVRAALSPDGATLWVTARKDNAVYAFSAAKLIAGDAGAKVATVAVGAAPVPVIVTPDGKFVLTGNSNRFGEGTSGNQSVEIIDAAAHAVVGRFETGRFPRQFEIDRSGSTIFLSNYGSNTVTIIDPSALPAKP